MAVFLYLGDHAGLIIDHHQGSRFGPFDLFTDNSAHTAIPTDDKVFLECLELTFQFEQKLNFIPGQHVKILVDEDNWRAYSIAKSNQYNLSLIIDTRPGGIGSNYAKNIQINEFSLFRLHLTDLIYHKSKNDIMFIATGTGFVPFIHILDELKKKNIKHNVVILFGCLKESTCQS